MKKTLVALTIALASSAALADKQPVTVVLTAQSTMTQGMAMVLTPGKAAGHRIRDLGGEGVRVPDAAWRTAEVVVIGGGVAGLCAAWWLDRAGVKDVVVLELDRVVGGTAQAGASAVTPYPWGAHYVVSPLRHQTSMIALLEEMGALDGTDDHGEPVAAEDLRVRELEERVLLRLVPTMDFIDEKNIPISEVGQNTCQVTCPFDGWSGRYT